MFRSAGIDAMQFPGSRSNDGSRRRGSLLSLIRDGMLALEAYALGDESRSRLPVVS